MTIGLDISARATRPYGVTFTVTAQPVGYSCRETVRLPFPKAPPPTISGRRFSLPSEVPMLLHRRIALALAHLRAARYDGCASDIKRAERRLNGLLDELPRCPTGNARMEC